MRTFWLAVGLALFWGISTGWAEEPAAVAAPSGLEWLQSFGKQREEWLLAALLTVRSAGVELPERYLEYDSGLRRYLLRHPSIQPAPLTDGLAAYIYEKDASSRAALDKLRRPKS